MDPVAAPGNAEERGGARPEGRRRRRRRSLNFLPFLRLHLASPLPFKLPLKPFKHRGRSNPDGRGYDPESHSRQNGIVGYDKVGEMYPPTTTTTTGTLSSPYGLAFSGAGRRLQLRAAAAEPAGNWCAAVRRRLIRRFLRESRISAGGGGDGGGGPRSVAPETPRRI